jgi:uncharacterized peroxidase-related enzyme
MAHIELHIAPQLGREFPGIVGPMTYRPETAAPINALVNILLRGESTLSRGERELIATHVSWRNDCYFCQTNHGAVAAAQLNHDETLVQTVMTDWIHAEISPKTQGSAEHCGQGSEGRKTGDRR